jgi:3',5'-cyclic AMP phosphodiesterase CpdA
MLAWLRERLGGSTAATPDAPDMVGYVHSAISDLGASITLPGLPRPLRLMHISDSHVDLGLDEGDLRAEEFVELERRVLAGDEVTDVQAAQLGAYPMVASYAGGKPQRSPSDRTLPAAVAFEQQVAEAVGIDADLIILTGDNVNFPSERAVAHMVSVLDGSGIPYLFVAGNHDWDMHAQPGSPEERRDGWQSSVLAPLYGGRDPKAWFEDISGVRIVALDNSTGEVSPEQVTFFRHVATDSPLPVLLLVHIPLYSPQLNNAISSVPFSRRPGAEVEPAAGASALCGHPDDQTTTVATRELMEVVDSCEKLAAVLSGHIHTAQAHGIGKHGGMQYVADAGVFGGYRVIDLMPTTSPKL